MTTKSFDMEKALVLLSDLNYQIECAEKGCRDGMTYRMDHQLLMLLLLCRLTLHGAVERVGEMEERALEERVADMHLRIRQGYDKAVADTWREALPKMEARAQQAERERDEAMADFQETAMLLRKAEAARDEAAQERDQLRARLAALAYQPAFPGSEEYERVLKQLLDAKTQIRYLEDFMKSTKQNHSCRGKIADAALDELARIRDTLKGADRNLLDNALFCCRCAANIAAGRGDEYKKC